MRNWAYRRLRRVLRNPGLTGCSPWLPSAAQLEGLLAPLIGNFPRAHIAVAFSGGADSTALLAALATLARRHRTCAARGARRSRIAARIAQVGTALRAARAGVARAHTHRVCGACVSTSRAGSPTEAAARTARYAAFGANTRSLRTNASSRRTPSKTRRRPCCCSCCVARVSRVRAMHADAPRRAAARAAAARCVARVRAQPRAAVDLRIHLQSRSRASIASTCGRQILPRLRPAGRELRVRSRAVHAMHRMRDACSPGSPARTSTRRLMGKTCR